MIAVSGTPDTLLSTFLILCVFNSSKNSLKHEEEWIELKIKLESDLPPLFGYYIKYIREDL